MGSCNTFVFYLGLMGYYVCKGAKLKCAMGSEQPELSGKPMAGIADSKPMVNIKPFGKCKSLANPVVASATTANYGRLQEMPCVPNTMSPWLNGKMNLIIKGSPALLDTSKCMCVWAGVVEVADAGQSTVKEGGPMNVSIRTDSPSDAPSSQASGIGGGSLAAQGLAPRSAAASAAPQRAATGTAPQNAGASLQQSAGAGGAASTAKLLIRGVAGDREAAPGGKADYWVTEYSREAGDVSPQDRFRIRWAVKVDGGIMELTGRTGDSLTLDIMNEWAGKEIVVMACVEGFNEKVSQRTRVGGAVSAAATKTLITGVEQEVRGQAYPWQKITYMVTRYNKSEVSQKDRDSVKWAIEANGEQKALGDKKGDRIVIEMEEGWAGGEILVMPYLSKPTKDVAAKTKVEYPVTLHFDGKFLLLRVIRESEVLRFSYKAVSGRPLKDGSFDYSKKRQAMKDKGPIPEGGYHINPQEIQYTADRNLVERTIDILGGVIGAITGKPQGTYPGGTTAWGIGRVWIQPKQVVIDGVIRDNFSIHGGTEPGSAGCIDLANNDKDFFETLEKYKENIIKIPLTVKY